MPTQNMLAKQLYCTKKFDVARAEPAEANSLCAERPFLAIPYPLA